MGIIVDTCIFVQAERNGDLAALKTYSDDTYISAITVSELMVGVHRADSEARRVKRSAFVDMILAHIPALDFTAQVAHVHAEICASLTKQGYRIGAHDLLIAATALSFNHAVLTFNKGEFERIPGLKII
jgi:predicted nucleic acid-binding protein